MKAPWSLVILLLSTFAHSCDSVSGPPTDTVGASDTVEPVESADTAASPPFRGRFVLPKAQRGAPPTAGGDPWVYRRRHLCKRRESVEWDCDLDVNRAIERPLRRTRGRR